VRTIRRLVGFRRLRIYEAVATVAALSALAATGSAGDPPAVRDLSSALEAIREKADVPGLVGLTFSGDRVVAQGAAGVRRRGGKDGITIADRMHLGSCTKAMTATLCALLVAEGRLRWEDRPAGSFAKDVAKIDPGWKDATLEMLLRHRGGAPEAFDADGLWARLWGHTGPPRAARRELLEGVLCRPPSAPPGKRFEYSNAGYAIAGAMAEKATDIEFEKLLQARLFEPLGMASAGFGAPAGRGPGARSDQPIGHGADGKPVEPGPGDDNPDAIAPAGKAHASLPDWAKFVALHLRRGAGAPAALAKIDFARLHDPSRDADAASGGYAMGWATARAPWARGSGKDDASLVLEHAGSNTMWFAIARLVPERGFAVLVATNQGGDSGQRAASEAAEALTRDAVSNR
jgi:CubicO group peptidase (beta-lactamase class C family)